MQYKISFIDNDGNEFMGTTECFTTDGRYNLETVHHVCVETWTKAYKRNAIAGYNLRLNSFNNPIVKTVLF